MSPKRPQLVILIGAQASGKSTFYLHKFFNTHFRINLDMLKTRHREKLIFQACLAAKQSVVIDNTNPTRQDRGRHIEPAKSQAFFVRGYYMVTSLQDCLERNRTRADDLAVPGQAIRATWKKMEEPGLNEGFDELYSVGLYEGDFLITAESRTSRPSSADPR
ncbi:MAG: AAA family ATPase [Desulfomonilaceae bacterium]